MRILISLLWMVTAAGLASAFEVAGLATPESMIVDPVTGDYYISNINGGPADKDNNGFITRLDKNGRVTAMRFIEGGPLHAPKGLAIIGETLYVSDIDTVRGFDKTTGQRRQIINLQPQGALFLNDLAADDRGNLYVSDTAIFINPKALGTIFKIETRQQNRVTILVRNAALGAPNGLMIHPKTGQLLANTWGKDGKIVSISPNGQVEPFAEHPLWADLDGFDYDDAGNFYISSFTGGKIFRVLPDKSMTTVQSGLTTPADVHVDRKRNLLLIPSFTGNQIATLPISPITPKSP